MKKFLYLSIIICALFCFTGINAFADEGDDPDTYYVTLDAAGGTISGEASTEITQSKSEFQDINLSDYVPERDGFTFTGWYNKTKKVTGIKSSDFGDSTNRITVTAMYTKNSYSGKGLTFTLNANGGTIGDSESATYDFDVAGKSYGIALADYTPEKKDYKFTEWNTSADGSGKTVTMLYYSDFEKAADGGYDYSDTDNDSQKRNLTFYAQWEGAPAKGKITIGKKSWDSLQGDISFDTYYKKAVKVSISVPNGAEGGYLISGDSLSEDALAESSFSKYDGAFTISDDGSYVVYAQIKSGDKTTYISSEGFTIDSKAPVFDGITDGSVYCSEVSVTVTESNLEKLTVNDKEITLDDSKSFKLSPAKGAQTVIATDKAGNKTEVSVTVNKDHVAAPDDSNCTTPIVCKYCGKELEKGNSEHKLSKWKSNGNSTHSRTCENKGCGYKLTQDCSGGKATCTEKATCSGCGAKYGNKSKTNHTNLKKVDYVAATAATKGNIEYWYCSACGMYFRDKACTDSISKEDTVISKQAPKITGGNDVKWKQSSSDTLKFRSDADFADFVCVLVDGNEISSAYYTKTAGSIVIELKTSYLNTLKPGNHTLTIRSKTGDAVANFSVDAKATTTQTVTTEISTRVTTQATTEVTTQFEPYTTEAPSEYTMHEYTTRASKTTETTTEVTTERSSRHIDNYKSSDTVDKRKNRVRNLQLVILITVLVTILASFVIILISGRKKK